MIDNKQKWKRDGKRGKREREREKRKEEKQTYSLNIICVRVSDRTGSMLVSVSDKK